MNKFVFKKVNFMKQFSGRGLALPEEGERFIPNWERIGLKSKEEGIRRAIEFFLDTKKLVGATLTVWNETFINK